jgi:inorganic pyrophosphatase
MHPRYPSLVYPFDYGYLKGSASDGDGTGIEVWRGSADADRIVAVACTVDLVKCDSEIKVLVACTEEEMEIINRVHIENGFVKGILLRRAG